MAPLAAFWSLFQRELKAYFLSPLAYALLFALLTIQGVVFVLIVAWMANPLAPPGRPFDTFFGASWWLVIFIGPLLTMRLLAEERRSGSIEVLMTAPVTSFQVVASKYLAALVFYAILWAPTVTYAILVEAYSDLDWGIVAAGYLGVLLVGSLVLAMGTFASSLTKNQLIAGVVGIVLSFGLYIGSLFEDLVRSPEAKGIFDYVSVPRHLEEFIQGIVDTRRLVFYLTTSLFFLILSALSLESRKWR